jgi:hypothetical protein
MSDGTKAMIAFTIYTLLWEVLVWGGAAYIILSAGESFWWFVMALIVSSAQFKPATFQSFFALPEASNA